MKICILLSLLLFPVTSVIAQGISIGNNNQPPDASSILDLQANDKGLLLPRLTSVQRNAIVNPATGLTIYNTDTDCINYYDGSAWKELCGTCTPLPSVANAGADQLGLGNLTTTLAGNSPVNGSGQWTIISGVGGNIASPSLFNSSFTGQTGETYVLRWTISNACGSNFDEVTISFTSSSKRVFMTSTVYTGNLGGVSGADGICLARANAAGLGGSWKAWIATNSTAPATSFNQSSSPYELVNGTLVATNWSDFTDGSHAVPISLDEFGNTVPFSGNGSSFNCGSWLGGYFRITWTGTNPDGTFYNYTNPSYPNCHKTCNNWTSSSSSSTPGGTIWIMWNNANTGTCDQQHHLICVEQ